MSYKAFARDPKVLWTTDGLSGVLPNTSLKAPLWTISSINLDGFFISSKSETNCTIYYYFIVTGVLGLNVLSSPSTSSSPIWIQAAHILSIASISWVWNKTNNAFLNILYSCKSYDSPRSAHNFKHLKS